MGPQSPQEIQSLLHFGADVIRLDRPAQGVVYLAWLARPNAALKWCCYGVTGGIIGLATREGKIQASRDSRRTNQSAVSMDTGRTSALVKQ